MLQNKELFRKETPGLQPDLTHKSGKKAAKTTSEAIDVPAAALAGQAWPATLLEQVRAVAAVLSTANIALTVSALEASFKGRGPWKKSLPRILETLEALGRARREGEGWRS